MDSISVQEIYKSRNNLLEMLKPQGYDTQNYENTGINEVNSLINNKQLDMLLLKNNSKKLYVKYHLGKVLRAKDIQEYIEDLFTIEETLTKQDDLMIIIKDEPNDTLTKSINLIWETEQIFVSAMNIKILQFNILKHHLVPEHRVLNEEETNNVKKVYNIIDDSQLPDISRHSSIAKIIRIRPGEICEIIRPSKTGIKSKFYRICST